jgi:hypothetical protein
MTEIGIEGATAHAWLNSTRGAQPPDCLVSQARSSVSQGGFEALTGARQSAREKGLSAWDIFHGNVRVEYHDPR